MTFKTKIVFGFGIAVLSLLIVAMLSYRSFIRDEQDRRWVAHTYQVMEKLDSVQIDLIDAETGVRGFIISGDDDFLSDYNHGISRIDQDLREIRSLTADNPWQQHNLDLFEPVARVRLDQFVQRIARRRSGLTPDASMLLQKAGKHTMDNLRLQLGGMKAEEQKLLIQRRDNAARSSRQSKRFILVGNLLAFGFLAFAGMVIRKEIAQRRRAENEVRDLNAGLEQRVQERTAELQTREQDLSRSNAELQQFAYVASHDLQEPLRMVASFTQLLARRYGDKLDKDAHEFIAYAVDGATRMQTLISDLLTYSRAGTQTESFERMQLDVVLDQVLRTLKMSIEESHAVVTSDPMPAVVVDGAQIGQVFQNLLVNAIKFHGAMEPRIHIGAVKNGTVWKFSVRDNGIGIAKDHAERIFVIFQRLHTKTEYPGTGIGLAICKKIVERHGGHIWITDTPGGGTTFYFTIATNASLAPKEKENHVSVSHA
jgi:signal transduction histidine kinase